MEKRTIERNYVGLFSLVKAKKLKDALNLLGELVLASGKGDFISRFEELDTTYETLLKYAVDGAPDPERDKIYRNLQVSILELSDVARQYALMKDSNQHLYNLKRQIENRAGVVKEEAINSVDSLAFDDELASVLTESYVSAKDNKSEYLRHQETLSKIFNLILLTDKFKDADIKLVKSLWVSRNFPWYEQAIIISALTISSIRSFDVKKIELLMEFSMDSNEQIRQRALVGLFFSLYIYNSRLEFYPELLEEIEDLKAIPDIETNIEFIAIQLLKTKETEKISKKLNEEIFPEVAKFQPILKDKLDLDNILSDDFMEDKNPDWERVFEDAPDLLDKLQEISKLQLEGSDVFMAAFSRLKNFTFFDEMINWFRPFHIDNYIIRDALSREDKSFDADLFLDSLSQSFFLCNSDKYSFCLNIEQMPQMQKNMMIEMFRAEMEGLRELQNEDDMLNKSTHTKSIYSQYIHDLYRFYKLHPMRNEFTDIFKLRFDFYKSKFFKILVDDEKIIRNIAEFFFEREYYEQAFEIYKDLNEKGDNSLEVFQKMGYCSQKMRNYEDALNYYKMAELYDTNRAWNIKKIALCFRNVENYEESLKYYLEAEQLEPENLYVQTFIGHSYLDLKDYENALKYYFKVEFLAPDNKKVLRPIAWCSLALGKLETAKNYYLRLIESEANKYDLMNLGHVEWCLGNRQAALKNYKLSINSNDNNMKLFMAGFEEDKELIIKNGVDPDDIPLVLDYLKYIL